MWVRDFYTFTSYPDRDVQTGKLDAQMLLKPVPVTMSPVAMVEIVVDGLPILKKK